MTQKYIGNPLEVLPIDAPPAEDAIGNQALISRIQEAAEAAEQATASMENEQFKEIARRTIFEHVFNGDQELFAMRQVFETLKPFSTETKRRILYYIRDRLGQLK